MLKIESCNECTYYGYERQKDNKLGRFKCYYEKNLRKNGNPRILNSKRIYPGEIPGWCKLEDYPV